MSKEIDTCPCGQCSVCNCHLRAPREIYEAQSEAEIKAPQSDAGVDS
jgi:hypothetical protein